MSACSHNITPAISRTVRSPFTVATHNPLRFLQHKLKFISRTAESKTDTLFLCSASHFDTITRHDKQTNVTEQSEQSVSHARKAKTEQNTKTKHERASRGLDGQVARKSKERSRDITKDVRNATACDIDNTIRSKANAQVHVKRAQRVEGLSAKMTALIAEETAGR